MNHLKGFALSLGSLQIKHGSKDKMPASLPNWLANSMTARLGCFTDSNQPSTKASTEQPPTDYEPWLRALFPKFASQPLALHHHTAWQWAWALEPGIKPDPLVLVLPRGGGKSTTVEASTVAVGARQKRRYCLYVSGTQKKADDHVSSIASLLESGAIERYYPALGRRSLSKFGTSKGWRHNRLRTASGFTVDSLGLDVDVRGVKLDEDRPDLIVFDDIDASTDSPETIAKKIRIITQDILPAGSPDVAVIFTQNVVHYESIMARLCGLASEEADFLATRRVVGPIPALKGFQVERVPGSVRWVITSGEPTWVGQDRAACQSLLNDIGLRAFRAEAQHERTPPEGQAFPEWDQSVHVIEPFKIPDHWPKWRAVDYGYAAPYCCIWLTRDPSGRLIAYREDYGSGYNAKEQALRIRALSAGEKYFVSVGDPAMWATHREGERYRSIAAQYQEMGIGLTQASNARIIGWERVHELLDWTETSPPNLLVFKGCTNLIRTFPMIQSDPNKAEDVDTSQDDHALDSLRYGAMAAHWLDTIKRPKPRGYGVGKR